jgi:hypothetical protein
MKERLNNNSEVAHAWANQTQEKGRGSNYYFEGPVIYSYGGHFPIAAHHTTPTGAAVVLFTTDTYSSTTAKHICHTRRACSHLAVLNVPDVGDPRDGGRWAVRDHGAPDHAANIKYLMDAIVENIGKAGRARKYGADYISTAEALANDLNYYIEIWDIDQEKADIGGLMPAGDIEKIKARAAKYTAEAEERKRKAKEKAAAEEAADLETWAGGGSPGRNTFYNSAVRLRISPDGERIETSHGASVSTETARRAIGAWQAATIEPGYKLNGYTVDQVFKDHIIIGCHDISAAEIEQITAKLSAI